MPLLILSELCCFAKIHLFLPTQTSNFKSEKSVRPLLQNTIVNESLYTPMFEENSNFVHSFKNYEQSSAD